MKKFAFILGMVVLSAVLSACGNSAGNSKETAGNSATKETEKNTEALAESVKPTEPAQEEPVAPAAQDAADENGRIAATEYVFTAESEDQMIEGLIFAEDVTVNGDAGAVMFANCEFKKNIINKGTGETVVRFLPGNAFDKASKAVISSGIKDATMETLLPKMMFLCEPIEVTVEDAGAVVTFAECPVIMNGKTYAVEDSEMFVNESKGEFGEYKGQESNMHNVCTWIEGGEKKEMQVAVYADM